MNKLIKWSIVSVVLVGLAGWGIWSRIPKENEELLLADQVKTTKVKKALNVTAEVIRERSITDEIVVSGRLIPDEEVSLSFETSGKIVNLFFTEGSWVKKGELLAKVNDGPLQAQLKKLEAQLKLAEDRVYRQMTLLEKDAVSKEAYEQVQTDLASLKADIDLVKENILQTELRAPFDGVIGLRQVSEGAYASPSTVVATLTKITPLKIDFAVPERYAGEISKDLKLEFSVEGRLEPLTAQIYATESKVDETTHTLPVRAIYPNVRAELLPGRFTNIRLKTKEITGTIAIPTEAIVPEMGVDKVYLYKAGKAQPVEITKGIRTADRVQVLTGLTPGDTLITSGTMQLRTGLTVTLDEVADEQ